jgi:hypothetical protein
MIKESYSKLRQKLNKDDEKWLDLLLYSLDHHRSVLLQDAKENEEVNQKALLDFEATCGITQYYLRELLGVDLEDVYQC